MTQADQAATEGAERPTPRRGGLRTILRSWLMLLLVCALFSLHPVFRTTFWTRDYLPDIVQQSGRNIVLAVGMSFVVMTGGIDLSVGAVLALAGVGLAMALSGKPAAPPWLACAAAFPLAFFATGLLKRALASRWPNPPFAALVGVFLVLEAGIGGALVQALKGGLRVEGAIGFALLIGIGCGLLNGLVVSVGRVPPFVTTLGMMSVARGLTLYATNSQSVAADFPRLRVLGEGLPLVLIALAVVATGSLLLNRFQAGRYVLAIGGNEQAARLTGVPVETSKTLAYVLAGLCAAIGAVLVTAKFGTANTGAGTGAELDAIAAVVIGGTSLSGGQGSILNALVGALTITVITSGLVLVGIEVNLQQVILGGIIVLTVFIDQLRKRQG
jgi:ribose/xylose/arabinose/galactoside ABC-type transport system permease subunit